MSQGASLGVLLPTRNSAALLPDHMAAMADWLDLTDEVLAVDSDSKDGTQELLRQRLKQPQVRFLSHPPGLYASWNAGLKELTTEFAYISTVGETITRQGLQQLLDAARESRADVVLSKPAFKTVAGDTVEVIWPIDDIVRTLRISSSRRLQRLEAMVFACVHATGALTGSCASDLFRTDCLKRLPFPTEFGTAGDGIWSIRHAAQVAWTVVPGCFSTFLLHPTAASQSENRPRSGALRPDVVLRSAVEAWRQQGLVTDDDLAQLGWTELQTSLTGYLDEKASFDRYRKSRIPWVLNAWAWRARRQRERQLARLYACKESALRAAASREQARSSRGGAGSERHPSCATA
jgi:glycosyltransferase involved in cell wall biosynthesis